MEWLTQQKMIKWLIVILLVVNIISLSIIWILVTKNNPPRLGGEKPLGIMEMMQKELNLSEEQQKKFNELRESNSAHTRDLFNQINKMKNILSDEVNKIPMDTLKVNKLIGDLGVIQSQIEKLRVKHFNELLSLCTPEQREKFIPVLKNIYSGPPPRDRIGERPNPKPGEDRFNDPFRFPPDRRVPPPDQSR